LRDRVIQIIKKNTEELRERPAQDVTKLRPSNISDPFYLQLHNA